MSTGVRIPYPPPYQVGYFDRITYLNFLPRNAKKQPKFSYFLVFLALKFKSLSDARHFGRPIFCFLRPFLALAPRVIVHFQGQSFTLPGNRSLGLHNFKMYPRNWTLLIVQNPISGQCNRAEPKVWTRQSFSERRQSPPVLNGIIQDVSLEGYK